MTLESTLALRYLDREMSELERRVMERIDAIAPGGLTAEAVRAIMAEERAIVLPEPEPVIVEVEPEPEPDAVETLAETVEELAEVVAELAEPKPEPEPEPMPEPAPMPEPPAPEPDREPRRGSFWFRPLAIGKRVSE